MKLSEAEELLAAYRARYGDVELVLWDLDTGSYFKTDPANFEAQIMKDGTQRVSVGVNDYGDAHAERPVTRLLADTMDGYAGLAEFVCNLPGPVERVVAMLEETGPVRLEHREDGIRAAIPLLTLTGDRTMSPCDLPEVAYCVTSLGMRLSIEGMEGITLVAVHPGLQP